MGRCARVLAEVQRTTAGFRVHAADGSPVGVRVSGGDDKSPLRRTRSHRLVPRRCRKTNAFGEAETGERVGPVRYARQRVRVDPGRCRRSGAGAVRKGIADRSRSDVRRAFVPGSSGAARGTTACAVRARGVPSARSSPRGPQRRRRVPIGPRSSGVADRADGGAVPGSGRPSSGRSPGAERPTVAGVSLRFS